MSLLPPGFLGRWTRVALLSFGGPAGQIAVMHRIVVEEARAVSEERFLRALSFCMLLPGPEAQQLATYLGFLERGVLGGLIAGGLFVLPAALLLLGIAAAYASVGDADVVRAAFTGVQAVVMALVVEALQRVATRSLRSGHDAVVAAVSLAAIVGGAPFPLVVLAAGIWGAWAASGASAPAPRGDEPTERASRDGRRAAWILASMALISAAVPWLLWGPANVLSQLSLLTLTLATCSFGGAYAVLGWVSDVAVSQGWLTAPEMLDAVAVAETAPGPLVLVVPFVGYLAAARGGSVGVLGFALTTFWLFAPSFAFVLGFAGHIERIGTQPRFAASLGAIRAAVVGAVAWLAGWFCVVASGLSDGDVQAIRPGVVLLALVTALAMHRRPGVWPIPVAAALGALLWALGAPLDATPWATSSVGL
jgi:chromate transporter